MATEVKIVFNGPIVSVERVSSNIARIFFPDNSYVDSVAYEGTIYDTNVEGWGKLAGLLPMASTTTKFAQFERAAICYANSQLVGTDNTGVTFEIDGYEEEIYWSQMATNLVDQGYYIKIGDKEYGELKVEINTKAATSIQHVGSYDIDPADLQSGVKIVDGVATGTLKYVTEGPVVEAFGGTTGNFIALQFSNVPEGATVKAGIKSPVELDEDLSGVWIVTDEFTFKIITTLDGKETTQTIDLSQLVLTPES
jgi:hypothetical protein